MPVEEPSEETLNQIPNCSICEQPMMRLKRTAGNKFEAIWVCVTGKPNSRMPCDGSVFEIAFMND